MQSASIDISWLWFQHNDNVQQQILSYPHIKQKYATKDEFTNISERVAESFTASYVYIIFDGMTIILLFYTNNIIL